MDENAQFSPFKLMALFPLVKLAYLNLFLILIKNDILLHLTNLAADLITWLSLHWRPISLLNIDYKILCMQIILK